mgnify:CR=1 FL=1
MGTRDSRASSPLRRESLPVALSSLYAVKRRQGGHLLRSPARAGIERRILVFLGRAPRRTDDGIDVLPFADFAAELASGKL